jgi:enoyl-CoA hydratase/carnithine racemase
MRSPGPPAFERPSTTVTVERGTAWLRVGTGRPENVMTTDTYGDLLAALRWTASDRSTRTVVLIGAGADFSAGGDHARHRERDAADFRDHLGTLIEGATVIRTMGKPVIAAVRGRCTGGMNQVALLADLTIASRTSRFGQYGARSGSMPSLWGTQLLPLVIGEKRARELVYMCWEYDADEALGMGLVNRVVDDDQLETEVQRWADRLREMSPRSLRMAKTSMNLGSDLRSGGVWHAREMLSEVAGTPEYLEANASYLEGRLPTWAVDDGPDAD